MILEQGHGRRHGAHIGTTGIQVRLTAMKRITTIGPTRAGQVGRPKLEIGATRGKVGLTATHMGQAVAGPGGGRKKEPNIWSRGKQDHALGTKDALICPRSTTRETKRRRAAYHPPLCAP